MAKTIDTEKLLELQSSSDTLHLVETLQAKEFDKGHLPGAVCIPFSRIGGEARKRFALEDVIVVYCHDESCKASTRAAEKLEALGFRRVYEYAPGKRGWRERGFSLET